MKCLSSLPLLIILSVLFFSLSLGEPAEPQGRRRELLHSEVSRRGGASG